MEQNISLYSSEWCDVESSLIFFIGNKVRIENLEVIDDIVIELINSQCLVVGNYRDFDEGYSYSILLERYVVDCIRNDRNNMAVTKIRNFEEIKKNRLKEVIYHKAILNLVPREGIMIILQSSDISGDYIYNCYPATSSKTEWAMKTNVLETMDMKIKKHFESTAESEENGQFKVGVNFRKHILDKVRDYTFYEDENEKYLALEGTTLLYNKRVATTNSSNFRNYTYHFFCPQFDEKSFHIDTRVSVESSILKNSGVKELLDGVIIDIGVGDDETIVEISFSKQFNDRDLPEYGRISIQHNPVQRRVREKVIEDIYKGRIPSTYMYNTFNKFNTAGYSDNTGWEEFEKKLDNPREGFKPNDSQKEAIRKGIETKDLQLVWGPPGTGKTTVIVAWIEYFVSRGMKVLVSSQNNMAVDNVLTRVTKDPNINIVRIGNESKVQEEVKSFLPERKDQELYLRYKQSMEVAWVNFEGDSKKLKEMEDTISIVMDNLLEYQSTRETLKKFYTQLSTDIKKQNSEYKCILILKNEIEEIVEEIAKKEIYLRDTNKQNILIKALRYIYTIGVKRDLSKLNESYNQKCAEYRNKSELYNSEFMKIKSLIKSNEIDKLKNQFMKLGNILRGYEKLRMVFSSPYSTIEFNLNLDDPRESINNLESFKQRCEKAQTNIIKAGKALFSWDNELTVKRNEIMTNILVQSADVVGATCIGINSNRKFAGVDFDVAIIDEAGQIQVHNIIVPMTRAKKNLLLGDYQQIPPIVNEKVAKLCMENGVKTDLLEMSFFEFLFNEQKKFPDENKTMLKWQFRMPAEIADIISQEFYNEQYFSLDKKRGLKSLMPDMFTRPLVVLNTSDVEINKRKETKNPEGGYFNTYEIKIIEEIIASVLEKNGEKTINAKDIGIIAPYKKQVQNIKRALKSRFSIPTEEIDGMVASLDSFQGQERKLIIYSSTRSNDKETWEKRIGFLNELRRLNVAFTRCKEQLIIIGDMDFLSTCEHEEKNESGEIIPNKSERSFSKFIYELVRKVKNGSGEFLNSKDFLQRGRRD